MPELWIPGEPVAKGRPRVSTIGGRARMFTPKVTRDEEERVASLWSASTIPQGVPVSLAVHAFRGRPTSHYKKSGGLSASGRRMPDPLRRPDLDNIVKLVLDALNGVAFYDDSQVVEMYAFSQWALTEPGIQVRVDPWVRCTRLGDEPKDDR